jgi:transketolase
LRTTPNMQTWRPCDTVESAVAWKLALQRTDGPCALVFSRQGLPHQKREATQLADIARGAYVLRDGGVEPEAIIIATGSEVGLAMDSARALSDKGRQVRVVSMPCAELFCQQDAAYREQVLPSHILARVAVEASHEDYWYKFVGLDGRVCGMSSFGESAPAADLYTHFGITAAAVVETIEDILL